MPDQTEPIFLKQDDIIKWHAPGVISLANLGHVNAYTEITGNSQCVVLREEIKGNETYHVFASAVRHPALIARTLSDAPYMDLAKMPPRNRAEKMFLFDGGIQIYSETVGAKFGGWNLERNGRLWFATKSSTFFEAILGEARKPKEQERVIEAILRGYEIQDEIMREARE